MKKIFYIFGLVLISFYLAPRTYATEYWRFNDSSTAVSIDGVDYRMTYNLPAPSVNTSSSFLAQIKFRAQLKTAGSYNLALYKFSDAAHQNYVTAYLCNVHILSTTTNEAYCGPDGVSVALESGYYYGLSFYETGGTPNTSTIWAKSGGSVGTTNWLGSNWPNYTEPFEFCLTEYTNSSTDCLAPTSTPSTPSTTVQFYIPQDNTNYGVEFSDWEVTLNNIKANHKYDIYTYYYKENLETLTYIDNVTFYSNSILDIDPTVTSTNVSFPKRKTLSDGISTTTWKTYIIAKDTNISSSTYEFISPTGTITYYIGPVKSSSTSSFYNNISVYTRATTTLESSTTMFTSMCDGEKGFWAGLCSIADILVNPSQGAQQALTNEITTWQYTFPFSILFGTFQDLEGNLPDAQATLFAAKTLDFTIGNHTYTILNSSTLINAIGTQAKENYFTLISMFLWTMFAFAAIHAIITIL